MTRSDNRIDFTIAYPDILPPPNSWPEDQYGLPIFFNSIPPPIINVHLRAWKLFEIPLGDLTLLPGSGGAVGEGTEEEKVVFEGWLRGVWKEKDELMDYFLVHGTFLPSTTTPPSLSTSSSIVVGKDDGRKGEYKIPIKLRDQKEQLTALSYLVPLWVGLGSWYLSKKYW